MLWEYLMHVMASWKGNVIMGDFNEVRYSNERFGSNFNVKGANAFNSFIIQAGLEEIPLGEVYGFEKLIVETWSDIAACGSNDMLNLMHKLKNLKMKIRGWNSMRQSFKNSKIMLKSKLADVELVIDKGNASEEVIYKLLEIVNSINKLEKQQAMETAKKAKIKWAIEAGVTIEEIKNAVWDYGTDKSPGPDGFSFDFYRRFWSVIQKDVVAAVKCFLHYASIPNGVIHPS
nr:RNA-directed DNA polymerase, eukaryota [Tanacetum cinerariifolium]